MSATSLRRATSASSSRASTSVSVADLLHRRRARGSRPQELDFPDESGTGQTNSTYEGEGGVPVGSLFNRLLYAVKFQEGNILLSNFVNADSKILYEREPRERIEKVAPWLTLDGDPYPAVVEGASSTSSTATRRRTTTRTPRAARSRRRPSTR